MSGPSRYTTLILDLGDVLFTWSPKTKTSISPRVLKDVLNSPVWFEYECGRISQEDCYASVGKAFTLEPSEIDSAFKQARASMESNEDLIALVRELKALSNGRLRVFALSNISKPDYEYVKTLPADWSIFDRVFPSAFVGERKPHLGVYKHFENVQPARSLGMRGVVFEKFQDVNRALRNIFGDPAERGRSFLRENAKRLNSVLETGEVFDENYAQLLIVELTNDNQLVNLPDDNEIWNYFYEKALFGQHIPDDLDTTSLALTVLKKEPKAASSVMNKMLEYRDTDGILQTYFDEKLQKLDPLTNVNVLNLFYTYGRGDELQESLGWIRSTLLYRAYIGESRFYPSADYFLYFVYRLTSCTVELALLKTLLAERVAERVGAEGDAVDLGLRLFMCAGLDVENKVDLQKLLDMQHEDGGWDGGYVYKFSTPGIRVSNRGLATAAAIEGIESMKRAGDEE
ncbi:HAD-like protein [Obba rivulosa]|uniref:HAD-like protein n=1 Tax=Obba rivulosa TaxID=1052685 RepID=A0A8E2AVR2_9APHY|nr:HAD-like protein [Obba rivulosa]